MGFFKKNSLIFFGLGIIVLFFITRFYNLLGLPIFTDEAIYVRWAQIASNDANWRFISLTDGKQPMFVWIGMVLMKFISDPLLAGRTVSVIAGLFSTIGVFFLANEIFKNRKIGLLTSFVYVIYPFSLVYDRMALYDSLVAMFIIWSIYFEILLARRIRLDIALILGMIIGGGMLTKTNADFALLFLPFSLLFFDFRDKKRIKKLSLWIAYAFAACSIAFAMYSVLRLSPFLYIITEKNALFVYPISEWISHPFTYFFSNLSALINWLSIYMTLPFLVLVVSSFFVGKKFIKEKLFLLIVFIVPFIYLAFFGKNIYPRFILFMTLPLLILGSYTFYNLISFVKKIFLKVIIVIVFLATFVVNDYYIVTDFANAMVPKSDKGQFILSWPSGVGVKETVSYLTEKSKTEKIYVATQGTFGLMPFALEMYFVNNPNVIIKGFWPINKDIPTEVIEASKKMPTYFVFYQDCLDCVHAGMTPETWNKQTEIVFQIERAEKERYYTLYQVK